MKTTADFLDELRAKLGVPSDNKLAQAMGWKRQQVTVWRQRRETFGDATALKIARALEVDPAYIMACMAWQRAKTPETRSAWERIAAKVAACFVLGIALQGAPSPAPASILHNQNVPTVPASVAGDGNTHMRQRRRAVAWIRGALGLSRLVRAFTLALALAAPGASYAADPWTGADTARQATVTALLAVDWGQSRYIAQHLRRYRESNPVLGDQPSTGQVNAYFAGAIIAHAAVSYVLPAQWRAGWQYVWIGAELNQAIRNYQIGVRVAF